MKELNGEELGKIKEGLSLASKRQDIQYQLDIGKRQKSELLNTVVTTSDEDILTIIDNNLKDWTPSDLKKFLTDSNKKSKQKMSDELKKRIDSFFINPDTNESIELNSKSMKLQNEYEQYDFKRGFLNYCCTVNYYNKQIDAELKKMDEAQEEFNRDIALVMNPLIGSIISYGKALIEQSEKEEDPNKAKILKQRGISIVDTCNMSPFIQLLKSNTSIITNTLKDFNNEQRLIQLGQRYGNKIKKIKNNINLINFIGSTKHDTFEYKHLPKDDYTEGQEGLFVFILIRYFASSDMNNQQISFQHTIIYIILYAFEKDLFEDETKESIRLAIKNLLQLFQ